MKQISTSALNKWAIDLFLAMGSEAAEARLAAEHLIGANLAGHDSHGIGMVPRYVLSWKANELQLNQRVTVDMDSGSMLSVNGNRGLGQSVTVQAMELAIARARQHGVCVMGLKHAHHLGRVGHWAEQAISAGMVSVHFVNAVSYPIVAPHGGSQPRIVTNPFTVGIPVPGRDPVLLDFATSAIAMGKVRVALNKGVPVPPNCLLDKDGHATTDPAVLFPPPGEARGALLPFSGHKGYALGMVCELLGAALTGGETTRPANLQNKHAIWNNMLCIVFDPARIGSASMFSEEFAAYIDWVQSARLAQGSEEILLPGEPERRSRAARRERMPVDDETLQQLDHAARTVEEVKGRSPGPASALAS